MLDGPKIIQTMQMIGMIVGEKNAMNRPNLGTQ
jgi:hypothetical protein